MSGRCDTCGKAALSDADTRRLVLFLIAIGISLVSFGMTIYNMGFTRGMAVPC